MYGAILGDMIGAPYEFDRGDKTKEFSLFVKESQFTDDTVMTVAVAEALLGTHKASVERIRGALVRSMKRWGKRYPHAGYGGMFRRWLRSWNPEPYNSFGNGSAMRVCAAGWLSDTLEGTRRLARLTAEVTHNHPEGIKARTTSSGSSATTSPAPATRFGPATAMWRAARRPSRRPSPPFWRGRTSRM